MDWTCQQNATDVHSKSGHALDSSRKKREVANERAVEEIREERSEVGPGRKADSKQATMAFSVSSLCVRVD